MSTTPNSDPADLELIVRFLAGDCTPDEVAAVQRWLSANPENARLLTALRAAFDVGASEPPASDQHAAWARTVERLGEAERGAADAISESQARPPRGRRSEGRGSARPLRTVHSWNDAMARRDADARKRQNALRRVAITRLAAAAVIIVVAGGLILQRIRSESGASLVTQVSAPPREYAAPRGQRADLRLSDGTHVVLAPGSRLTVPATYDSAARTVVLDGQAWFDVIHSAPKPFTVLAGSAVVRDIGTTFDVRAFADEPVVRVVVTQGSVRVSRAPASPLGRAEQSDTGTVMYAGDVARLQTSGGWSVVHGADTTKYVQWTSGILEFDRAPVRAALSELSRWYDVEFRLADSTLAGRTLSGRLREQSISEVTRLVALSLEARAERVGQTVFLRARNRQ